MVKNKVIISWEIDDCKMCPNYRLSRGIHQCSLNIACMLKVKFTVKDMVNVIEIPIPDECPLLEVKQD